MEMHSFYEAVVGRCKDLTDGLVKSIKPSDETAEQAVRLSLETFAPIPSLRLLETLSRVCFEAGLRTEEGRPVRPEVRFVPVVAFEQHFAHQSVRFESPLKFDARLLAKLSPALAGSGVWLAVEQDAAAASLRAHSIVLLDQDEYAPFAVRVVAPGQLQFEYMRTPIAEWRGLSPQLLPGASGMQFGDLLHAFPAPGPHATTCIWAMQDVATSLRGRHLGGTVAVLPDGTLAEYLRPGHRVNQARLEAWPAVVHERGAAYWSPTMKWREREYRQLVEFFASLAAVDGSIVMGADLRLLEFGSKLMAPDWSGELEITSDQHDSFRCPVKQRFPGTRHSSAVNFVHALPGSVAMVVSHDGDVTFFYRVGDMVRAYQPDGHLGPGVQ